jgi:SAM-dependent methyltransferase
MDLKESIAIDPYALNEDGTSNLITVIMFPAGSETFSVPTLSTRQVICGPTLSTKMDGDLYISIQTPLGHFDAADVLSVLPPEQTPEIIIVWADSGASMFASNLEKFPHCRKLLMVGDTHHQPCALQNLLIYAASNPFDAIILMFRQHVHFFRDAGFKNVHWIQGQMTFPKVKPVTPNPRKEIALLGSSGDPHPQRRRVVNMLEIGRYPLVTGFFSHADAMQLYSEVQICLNVSLNGDMNWRPFEVMGAGGFLITDRLSHFSGLDILFEEGQHYIGFETLSELKAKLDHYLDRPEECRRIAQQAQQRYLQEFSREQITTEIWDRLLHNRCRPIFDIDADERLGVSYTNSINMLPRVALYETVQEHHRRQAETRILFLADTASLYISDCADLPRAIIFVESQDGQPRPDLNKILPYKKITYIAPDMALTEEWDVIIGGQSKDARSIAGLYKTQTIILPDWPFIFNQPALVTEAPPGFQPSLTGQAIFERRPFVHLGLTAQKYGEYGKDIKNTSSSIGIQDRCVLEIGGCAPIDLVINAGRARAWVGLVEEFDEGILPSALDTAETLRCLRTLPEHGGYRASLADLPSAFDGQFDLICSYQNLEKRSDFVAFLKKIFDALRPAGRIYFTIDPIWTAPDGHCLPEIRDAAGHKFSRANNPIPPWGHLLMEETELRTHLLRQTDEITAGKIVDYVYRSPHLNRMFAEDYQAAFQQVHISKGVGKVISVSHPPPDILNALKEKYPSCNSFEQAGLNYNLLK